MKANELRIGNLFVDKYTKEVISVIELTEDVITFTGEFTGIWQAEPIPLTEEWLLKFGGEKEYYEPDSDEYYLIIRHDKFDITFEDENTIYLYISDETFPIKYVHRLQNIWFALTGEELIYNDSKL